MPAPTRTKLTRMRPTTLSKRQAPLCQSMEKTECGQVGYRFGTWLELTRYRQTCLRDVLTMRSLRGRTMRAQTAQTSLMVGLQTEAAVLLKLTSHNHCSTAITRLLEARAGCKTATVASNYERFKRYRLHACYDDATQSNFELKLWRDEAAHFNSFLLSKGLMLLEILGSWIILIFKY